MCRGTTTLIGYSQYAGTVAPQPHSKSSTESQTSRRLGNLEGKLLVRNLARSQVNTLDETSRPSYRFRHKLHDSAGLRILFGTISHVVVQSFFVCTQLVPSPQNLSTYFAEFRAAYFSFRLNLTLPDSMHISDPDLPFGARLTLRDDEVQLWKIDLAAVAAAERRWQEILSADERVRAARFHFEHDRQHFTATRALLRTLLASYIGGEAAGLVFRYSENDKPSLDQQTPQDPVEFNVSHSGTTALLAFTRGRALGVDLELIREDFDPAALAHRFFSRHEQSQLAALPPSQKYSSFFRCWTRKEAYIKAVGTGLSIPLDRFDVSLRPGDENALLATRPDASEAAMWSLREVPVGDGYIAALCVRGHGWHLKS